MGDVPYAPSEDLLLPKQVAELPQSAEFVVHLGDIKSGATACDEAVYVKVSGMLAKSTRPVFVIPGDNEWNDCSAPDEAWKFWETHFLRFDQRWPHKLRVFRQLQREENFSFVQGNVLVIGINLVGGRVHDEQEWKTRHAENLRWTRQNLEQFGEAVDSLVLLGHALPLAKHDDFFDEFETDALQFKKPILYIHGDGHRWVKDRPFSAKNILRVEVDQGGIASPVLVTVTNDPKEPFQFDRREAGE